MSFGRLGSLGSGFGRLGGGGSGSVVTPGIIAAGGGSYAWTGQDATLTVTVQRSVVADAGSYAWIGDTMTPLQDHFVTASGGSYAWTGQDATLMVSGGFDPLTLFSGGAVGLWLDPSDSATTFQDSALTTPAASGNPLGGLTDKSGNGNNVLQATAGLRPTLTNASGKWYFETDNIDDYLRATFTITQPYYLMVAVNIQAMANNDQMIGGVTANAGALFNSSGNMTMYAGSTGPTRAFSTSTNYVFTAFFNGVSSILRLNGSASGTGSAGTTAPGGITIGASNTPNSFSGVRFYGVIMTTKALSAGEITDAESYLTSKF